MKYSTAFHPQTDGQTEVTNCLEVYLRCYAGEKPKTWPSWLSWAEFWFNTNFNISIGMTLFKALYGRDPPPIIKGPAILSSVEAVNVQVGQCDTILDQLHHHLKQAQQRMKRQADKRRRDVQLAEGDWVYLKVTPYRWHSLAKCRNEKFSPRFYGPFQVQQRVGSVAYRLDLPEGSKIHPIFHVSKLKKAVPAAYQSQPLPPALTASWELQPQIEDLLQLRYDKKGSVEALVKWAHLPECDN